jgi:hypothetical protein
MYAQSGVGIGRDELCGRLTILAGTESTSSRSSKLAWAAIFH